MRSFWPLMFIITVAWTYILWRRLLAYLRYFQQEGYEALRFLRWLKAQSLADPAFWMSLLSAFLYPLTPVIAIVLFLAAMTFLGLAQPDPRRSGKILLRLTWRAKRILAVAFVLVLAGWIVITWIGINSGLRAAFIASSALLALLPLCLIAGNVLLVPYEKYVQAGYEAEARRRIADISPFVIGITGSYGKSSSKAMLAHILKFYAPTLAASGSINTRMGITRHIREDLEYGYKYMVVEMGAFKTGSIHRLCQLTPPSAALITAVGDMHLERFGSVDQIVKAKSELAQALPPGGLLVVNADSPGALKIAKNSHCRTLLYGETSTEDLATRLQEIVFSKQGTSFVLHTKHAVHRCFTPLLGRPIILNLAGAFTLAVALGVDPDLVVASMRTLRPVSNRLEVVEEGGISWIRDAYNSNQSGFRAALEVAAALPANRRFLATPGVIELGSDQYGVNRALSKEAAMICDNTLVVSDTNRAAFEIGHRDCGRESRLVPVPNRTQAFQWLRKNVRAGDIVILENDLPDLYEQSAGLFLKKNSSASGAGKVRPS
jgi:UDP-N-acetylmuramoyl-tripeptide--D-alanyl-D-alanine ligase